VSERLPYLSAGCGGREKGVPDAISVKKFRGAVSRDARCVPLGKKKEKADATDKRTATLSSQLAGQNGKRTPFQTHFISAFQNT
jgi:hypothetical protein